MRSQISTRRWHRVLATLLGLALVAGACGDDDSSGDDAAPDDTSDESSTTTEAPDEGEPVPGGRLVYGLEAAAQSPWTPQQVICDVSCHMVMRTVFDTLTLAVEGEDGPEIAPHLLESYESNEDFTEWTLTPRSGITFHDGTPFDANAIKVNLDGHLTSFLTGAALLNVEAVEVVDDATVVRMKSSWGTFPDYLAGQIGYMASPTWLAAVADGSAQPDEPVGTGPFVFRSYEPGGSFIATKNAEYWRADEGLPYLDEIEMRVIADTQARRTALLNGDIDMTHESSGESISVLRREDGIEKTELTEYPEESYTLLNVSNPDSAISDVRIRRAMAHAVDPDVYIERRNGGVSEPANGPWGPGQPGELDDTGYPEFDQEKARELVEEYKAEKGIEGPVPISYTTTSDPINLGTAELLKQFWDAVGFRTEIAQIEQGQFIVTALQGDFEAFGWRLHSGFNPDTQRIWWHSEAATCGVRDTCPDGGDPGLALNFGRIRDDVIDEALDTIRGTNDPEVIEEQAEIINKRFGEQAYNLWRHHTIWMIARQPHVNGLGTWTLPGDGPTVMPGNGIGGTHDVVGLWCDGGQCGS